MAMFFVLDVAADQNALKKFSAYEVAKSDRSSKPAPFAL